MSSLNFPSNPTIGQIHTVGNNSWQWTGSSWIKIEPLVHTFNNVIVTSSTQATSTTTGALIVTGGVGIGGDLYVAGTFYAGGDAVLTTSSFAYSVNEGVDMEISLSSATGALIFSNISTLQSVTTRGFTTSNRINITNITVSTSTMSGALVVTGGVGIGENLVVQNNISGGTLTGRNLTQGRIVFVGTNSQLTDASNLTYNDLINVISMGAGSSTTATNIAGGGPGTIPYQLASGITRFVSTGTAGFILSSNGTSPPTWIPNTPLMTTATSIFGGNAGAILYQQTANSTTFLTLSGTENAIVAAGTNSPKYVTQIEAKSGVSSASTSSSQSLRVTAGGLGIVGDSYFADNLGLGATLTVFGTTDSTTTSSGALQVVGGAGIAKNLTVGNSITVGSVLNSTVVPALYSNNFIMSSYTSPVITTPGLKTLDQFAEAAYRSAKYMIQVVDGTSVHIVEMMITHNGSHVYKNEYGLITTAGELGTFNATTNGTTVTLTFNPTSPSNMIIKLVRLGIST
jgi:hypothetical protein